MGEVFKAHGTRLDRSAAINISGQQFSERFERETRAVAALNHPNVCTLYDVGPGFPVNEYVERTPVKGPLPLEQAIPVAVQIAGAGDAAHRRGIVRRLDWIGPGAVRGHGPAGASRSRERWVWDAARPRLAVAAGFPFWHGGAKPVAKRVMQFPFTETGASFQVHNEMIEGVNS